MQKEKTIKYFTKSMLLMAADDAINKNRNRQLDVEKIEVLPDSYKYPIGLALPHNDVEWRVQIFMPPLEEDGDPVEAWLDISFEMYDSLREVKMPIH